MAFNLYKQQYQIIRAENPLLFSMYDDYNRNIRHLLTHVLVNERNLQSDNEQLTNELERLKNIINTCNKCYDKSVEDE